MRRLWLNNVTPLYDCLILWWHMWYHMTMKYSAIILDTNVLFAGLYSSNGASFKVLRYIDDGLVTPIISTTLLFEYEDVLRREKEKLSLSNKQIESVLDNLCALGKFQEIHFLWRPYLKDPKDDHVLEVAVAAEASPIVTFNIKDFKGCG